MSAEPSKDLFSSMLTTESAENKKVTQLLDINSIQTESRLASVTRQTSTTFAHQTDETDFHSSTNSPQPTTTGTHDTAALSAALAQNSIPKPPTPSSPTRTMSSFVVKPTPLSFREQPLSPVSVLAPVTSSLSQQLQKHRTSQSTGPPPGLRGVMATGVYNDDVKTDSTAKDPVVIHGVGAVSMSAPDPDSLSCTIYLPDLPKQHTRTPFFVQLAAPLDCTARQLIQLARRQFHADLTRLCLTAAQFVDPVLAAHVTTRKLARLQRERAEVQRLGHSHSSLSYSVSMADPEPVPPPITTSTSALLGVGAPGAYSAQHMHAQYMHAQHAHAASAAAAQRYPLGAEPGPQYSYHGGSYSSVGSAGSVSSAQNPATGSSHGSYNAGLAPATDVRVASPIRQLRDDTAIVSASGSGSGSKRRGKGTPSRRPCALILPANSPCVLQQQAGGAPTASGPSLSAAAGGMSRHSSSTNVHGMAATATSTTLPAPSATNLDAAGTDAALAQLSIPPRASDDALSRSKGAGTPVSRAGSSLHRDRGLSATSEGLGAEEAVDGEPWRGSAATDREGAGPGGAKGGEESRGPVLEVGFSVEDVFEEEVGEMQLVVWSEELGEVDTNIPPLLPFASIRASGFDTFALQRMMAHAGRYSSMRGRSRYGGFTDDDEEEEEDDDGDFEYPSQRSRTSSHLPPRPPQHLIGSGLEPPPSAPPGPVEPSRGFFARLCACLRGDSTREHPLPDSGVPNTPQASHPQFARYGVGGDSHSVGRSTDGHGFSGGYGGGYAEAIEMRRRNVTADDDDDDDLDLEDLGLPIAKDAILHLPGRKL